MCITYTSDTGSLSFWLILYNSQPIYHWQSTDIPPRINGQCISWVLAAVLTEISAISWSICRPTLGRYLGWYVNQHISFDILAECRSICRLIHRSSVGWGVQIIIFFIIFFYYFFITHDPNFFECMWKLGTILVCERVGGWFSGQSFSIWNFLEYSNPPSPPQHWVFLLGIILLFLQVESVFSGYNIGIS